jgi:hypothetical protein
VIVPSSLILVDSGVHEPQQPFEGLAATIIRPDAASTLRIGRSRPGDFPDDGIASPLTYEGLCDLSPRLKPGETFEG